VASPSSRSPAIARLATLLTLTATFGLAWHDWCLSSVARAAEPPPRAGHPPADAGGRNAADLKATSFPRSVAEVRSAMIRRDLGAARKHLASAAQEAHSQEDRDQLDRLQTMLDYLNQFWTAVRGAMAKLNDAEEIVVGGQRAIVVESGQDSLAVKVAGRIRRYSVAMLPTPLVMMLVERHFAKNVDSQAVIGTFLAVDPKGDRDIAKRYWQEAAKADIDTEKLLVELDQFPLAAANRDQGARIRD
jgi:hypothetical protein